MRNGFFVGDFEVARGELACSRNILMEGVPNFLRDRLVGFDDDRVATTETNTFDV